MKPVCLLLVAISAVAKGQDLWCASWNASAKGAALKASRIHYSSGKVTANWELPPSNGGGFGWGIESTGSLWKIIGSSKEELTLALFRDGKISYSSRPNFGSPLSFGVNSEYQVTTGIYPANPRTFPVSFGPREKLRSGYALLTPAKKWLFIEGVDQDVPGAHPNEWYFAKFDYPKKFRFAIVVNAKTHAQNRLTESQFRKQLWPAARQAFDKFGAWKFFDNTVQRPGYAKDPAYFVSRIDSIQRSSFDHVYPEEGKTAVILKSGKVKYFKYAGMPIIDTKVVGREMFALSDNSIYDHSGNPYQNTKLHIFRVDQAVGLIRVKTHTFARGISYAFAD